MFLRSRITLLTIARRLAAVLTVAAVIAGPPYIACAEVPAQNAQSPLRRHLSNLSQIDLRPGVTSVQLHAWDRDHLLSPRSDHVDVSGDIFVMTKNSIVYGETFNSYMATMNGGVDSTFSVIEFVRKPTEKSQLAAITSDSVEDHPENSMASVDFVDGMFDGKHETFLFTTERTNFDKASTSPTRVKITFYRLQIMTDGPPAAIFFEQVSFVSRAKYCDCGVALFREIGVPLKNSNGPASSVDGCIDGSVPN